MNTSIVQAIFLHILIPELARWLARRSQSGELLPTKEEILAQLDARANVVIAAGEDFLRSKDAL